MTTPAGAPGGNRPRTGAGGQSSVLGAFVYLTVTSTRNRFRQQLRRLRQPRYALATLFAIVYLGFFIAPGWRHTGRAPAELFLGGDQLLLASVGGLLLVAYWWLIGKDSSALAFSEAEMLFLFPAPTTRRQLIQFKLIRVQVVILINILVWTLLLGRGRGTGELIWLRPLSLWVLISTMHLHRLGATLTRANLTSNGSAGLRRSGPVAALLLLMLGAVAMGIARAWPGAAPLSVPTLLEAAHSAAAHPPASWALTPIRLILAPIFATTLDGWLHAIWPAVVIMLLHFAWVLGTDAAFEEAAVEASAARARRAASRRASRGSGGRVSRRALILRLPLRPVGEPAVAIAWKNVLTAMRSDSFTRTAFIFGLGSVVAGFIGYIRPQLAGFIAGITFMWSMMLLVMGPIWLRTDLRADLPRLELLRTYPVDPRHFVAAEIASTTLVLSIIQLFIVVALFLATLRVPEITMPVADRIALTIAVAMSLPTLNALGAAIHNAFALLLPGWVPLGGERKGGVEAVGQVYLLVVFVLILMALLLLVPGGVGALAFLVLAGQYGNWAAIAAVVVGSAVAAGELTLLIRWLAGIFTRTEPADVTA